MNQTDSESFSTRISIQVVTACAAIYRIIDNKPRIFVAKRAESKKFLPGVYELPGGHIEFGESAEDGLVREIMEEFSVMVAIEKPFMVFDYLDQQSRTQTFEILYLAQLVNSDADISLKPEDHSEYLWISEDEIESFFQINREPNDQEVLALRQAFEILSSS